MSKGNMITLGKNESSPKGFEKYPTDINQGLFNKVTNGSGGPLNVTKYSNLFLEGGLLDLFCDIAKKTIPGTQPGKRPKIYIGITPEYLETLTHIEKHLGGSSIPIGSCNNQATFTFGWLDRFMGINDFEKLKLFLTYYDNSRPENIHDFLKITEQYVRRVDDV